MAGLASIGIKIGYKASTSGSTYTNLPNVQAIPEMGGTPEKIDVTTLSDQSKKYVNGVTDNGDLDFTFLYDADGTTSSYKILKGLQDAKTTNSYQVEFPDGTTFTFDAEVSVKTNSAEVNGALTFTASFALQSEITTAFPNS